MYKYKWVCCCPQNGTLAFSAQWTLLVLQERNNSKDVNRPFYYQIKVHSNWLGAIVRFCSVLDPNEDTRQQFKNNSLIRRKNKRHFKGGKNSEHKWRLNCPESSRAGSIAECPKSQNQNPLGWNKVILERGNRYTWEAIRKYKIQPV